MGTYFYLLFMTMLVSLFAVIFSDGTTNGMLLGFGLMGFFCFPGLLAETTVMGWTEKSTGFLGMMITSYLFCKYIPFGYVIFG